MGLDDIAVGKHTQAKAGLEWATGPILSGAGLNFPFGESYI